MLGTFLITWRETLEAALVVGILMTYLQKIGQSRNYKYIYLGILIAIGASLAFAYFSDRIALLFQEGNQEVFEAAILFLAVAVLTYMVIWMHHNAREIKGKLQKQAELAMAGQRLFALALLTFISVFREGVETVLFLWGLFLQGGKDISTVLMLSGGLFGIGLAIFMAWLFFKGFGHLDLRLFFRITGVLLLFIAAGMLSSGVGKLSEIGWLPTLVEPFWNLSWLIDEQGVLGSVLAGLFGYKSRPSLMEVLAYFSYFCLIFFWFRWQNLRTLVSGK
jgi:high-affinity iron transporter